MARRKKKRGGRSASKRAPAIERTSTAEPPADASPDPSNDPSNGDVLRRRLEALRATLDAGDVDAARATLAAWLIELGADPGDPEAHPATPDPAAPRRALLPDDPDGPRFSILMAAYNRAALIGDAIESVLRQSFTDYELVIVDDGSTDDTPAVVARYAATEPRIRYIRKPVNEGRSATRNRAMSEARGTFVLWMADDDLLVDGMLARYDAILRAEPHIDVIYGKLQLFDGDTGRDLNVFTPNDWTGREAELLGAKLHGSCVPDGGTATRRALYRKVGEPIYDAEFVRAQDYELWTRLVEHGRFRFVDEVVYRYRKHDGGTSWGPFVDLSYDSKIIRRHFARQPIQKLFPQLDWTAPDVARRAALVQIGRLLVEYDDPRNAERFLAAADVGFDPVAFEARVAARIKAGDLDGAAALIDAFAAGWPLAEPVARLRTRVDAVRALRTDGAAALAAGRPSEAEQRAVEVQNTHGLGADVAKLRGRARVAGGDRREGLMFLVQAARLDVDDAPLADEVAALTAALELDGPRLDIASMRRRLRESFSPLDPATAPTPAPTSITAIVLADADPGVAIDPALASLRAQTHPPAEVIIVGATDEARAPDPAAALAAAAHPLVAWLTTDARWLPDHLARLSAALGDAAVAIADGVDPDDGTIHRADPERLAVEPCVPLCALLHRRDAAPAFTADGAWGFALDLLADRTPARVGPPTWLATPRAPEGVALDAIFARRDRVAPPLRRQQVERLTARGIDWPTRGRSGVAVVGGDDRAAFEATLDALAGTRCPHAIVVVMDTPSEATKAALIERGRREGFKLFATRRANRARALNMALARAGGDRIALLRAGARVEPGWLGRLRATPGDVVRPASNGAALLLSRAALTAVGGFDVVLDAPGFELADWLRRAEAAGLTFATSDEPIDGAVPPADPESAAAARYAAKWAGTPPTHLPLGSDAGFRPDLPPVEVVEAADRNLLITPPWADAAEITALAARLATLPDDVAVWLRAAPGQGPAAVAQLGDVDDRVLIIDAPLAPDREGGLYTAADAVYCAPRWPHADRDLRRAIDTERRVLRDADAFDAWLRGELA